MRTDQDYHRLCEIESRLKVESSIRLEDALWLFELASASDPIDWLQSRLSVEDHAEFHKLSDGYQALICQADGTVMVSGEGASLGAALEDLRRADVEQGGLST